MSIAKKVTGACAAVLLPALLLVASGLSIGVQVQASNKNIDHLTHLLRAQDREDSVQRDLRLAIGETTRVAERRGQVTEARWSELSADLRTFAAMPVGADDEHASAQPLELRKALAETQAATRGFVPTGQKLIEVARRDPAEIKEAMPSFLDALRQLETSRTKAREIVGRTIEDAVDANIVLSRRAMERSLVGAVAVTLALLAMAVWLRLSVVAPIVAIAARICDFSTNRKAEDGVPGLGRGDELGDLARGVLEYHEAVKERAAVQREIDFLAHHDALTRIPNRLLFEDRLAHELSRSHRTGDSVAVFAIDMDNFKEINDRYGHAGGDEALRRAAKLLSDCVRADDLVARIGGDEFAIIQVADRQPAAADALLSRIARATAGTVDAEVPIRMSIGVALSTADQDSEELYNSADMALYRAKADGRNTSRWFDTGLQEEVRLRRRLSRDLESAIDANQFRVVFQPVALPSMRVVGYESLLRWHHPELGEISPETFIPLAETTGQIGQLGLWMAERALAIAARWDHDLTLAINLSPLQFRQPDLVHALLDLAAEYDVAPTRLEFEVTESATLLGHHREAVLAALRKLQVAGASITMDDFGTGHSSLSNLKDFGFNKLKIDRSFVAVMLTHEPALSIVRAMIGLGRSLGMIIVAEGVETQEQLDLLRKWGCDQVQGYLIGRPASDEAIETVRNFDRPRRFQVA